MKLKLISDGTAGSGTRLIDEETGETVHGISKITYEVDVNSVLTKTTVEFFNIPVEISSKAEIEELQFGDNNFISHTKEQNIKINADSDHKVALMSGVKISEPDTGQSMSAVQELKWEATPDKVKAKVKRIKFK